ncbi:MAG: hypothetical protein U0Q18_26725 [Bryobacteraceae bacterium]
MSSGKVALLPVIAVALAAQSGTEPKPGAADYAVHAVIGKFAIGAEYMTHSFSGGGQTFVAKDYLVIEVAVFPPRGEHAVVSTSQFTLQVNGKKQVLYPQAVEFVAASLKYPDWETRPRLEAGAGPVIFGRPGPVERFPGDPQARRLPAPPRPPDANPSGQEPQQPVSADEIATQTALPEGEWRGTVSGYLYFAYKGKAKNIKSLTLHYAGPAGNAPIPLL